VRADARQSKALERLRPYITRPAIANEPKLWRNADISCGAYTTVNDRPLTGELEAAISRPQPAIS